MRDYNTSKSYAVPLQRASKDNHPTKLQVQTRTCHVLPADADRCLHVDMRGLQDADAVPHVLGKAQKVHRAASARDCIAVE